jgi:hypothetical protein
MLRQIADFVKHRKVPYRMFMSKHLCPNIYNGQPQAPPIVAHLAVAGIRKRFAGGFALRLYSCGVVPQRPERNH